MLKRLICISILLLIGLTFSCSINVKAVVENDISGERRKGLYFDKSLHIYEQELWTPIEINTEDSKVNFVENLLRGICVSLGDQIIKEMNKVGLNLDYIIYGNIGSGNYELPTFFKFHLGPNNIYGFISANFYKLFRSFALLAMVFIYLKIVAQVLTVGTARSRYNIKSSLGVYVLTWVLLYQAPFLLDILLYLRDLAQFILMKAGFGMLGMNHGLSLIDAFRNLAVSENAGFVDALLYNGTILLTLWFAFSYLGVALTQAIFFGLFPVICTSANGNKTKVALNNWIKEFFSLMTIPVIDCMLLLFPMAFTAFGAPDLLTLFVAFLIIPARGVVRRILGLGSNLGMEMAGLGFAMGAFGMMRTGARGIKNLKNRASGAIGDYKKGKMHDKLADAEENNVPGQSADGSSGASIPNLSSVDYSHNLPKATKGLDVSHNFPQMSERTQGVQEAQGADGMPRTSAYGSSNNYGTPMNREQADIMKSYANYKNFENPEFANHLSHREKADFYKKRARYNGIKAASTVVGAGLGGLVGFSASTYLSPSHKAMATMGGALAGGAAGNLASSATIGLRENSHKIGDFREEAVDRMKNLFNTSNNVDIQNDNTVEVSGTALTQAYQNPIERYGNEINATIKDVSQDPDVNFNAHVIQSEVYDRMVSKIMDNVGEPTQTDKTIANLEGIKQGCNYKAGVIANEVMDKLNLHGGDPSRIEINKYIHDTVNSMTLSDMRQQTEILREMDTHEGAI